MHAGNPCPGPDGDGNCSESCNEAADNCTAPDPNGSACSDGLFCNGTDTCNAGACSVHTGDPCLPLNTADGNCSTSCNEGRTTVRLPIRTAPAAATACSATVQIAATAAPARRTRAIHVRARTGTATAPNRATRPPTTARRPIQTVRRAAMDCSATAPTRAAAAPAPRTRAIPARAAPSAPTRATRARTTASIPPERRVPTTAVPARRTRATARARAPILPGTPARSAARESATRAIPPSTATARLRAVRRT